MNVQSVNGITREQRQCKPPKTLGIKQPDVFPLMRNRSGSFSAGRLMEFLMALIPYRTFWDQGYSNFNG